MSDVAFDLCREGLKKHRAKDYAGAAKSIQQAVAADAIAATEKLVAPKPDEVTAHANLSRFYTKKGHRSQSCSLCAGYFASDSLSMPHRRRDPWERSRK